MRTLAEWTLSLTPSLTEKTHAPLKATLMHWNQKYVIRVESGPLEQTYKLDALDFAGPEELRARLGDEFAASCERAFDVMRAELKALYSDARA